MPRTDQIVSIGTRKIPLLIGAGVTELYFTGGVHGRKERGFYRFWTLVGEDQYGSFTVVGRARRTLDAGDRIARMSMQRTVGNPADHRKIYAECYKLAQKHAHYVRPATERELQRWVVSHRADMAFCSGLCLVRGKKYTSVPKVPW